MTAGDSMRIFALNKSKQNDALVSASVRTTNGAELTAADVEAINTLPASDYKVLIERAMDINGLSDDGEPAKN